MSKRPQTTAVEHAAQVTPGAIMQLGFAFWGVALDPQSYLAERGQD